jgi:hypothetical protein
VVCVYDVFMFGVSDIFVGLAFLTTRFGKGRWTLSGMALLDVMDLKRSV